MSRRTTGALLIITSAILYASRYLAAAIYSSSFPGWSRDMFQDMLEYVGHGPVIWGIVALAAGIGYLVWAEVEEVSRSRR